LISLYGLWLVSLGLALAALLIMISLIVGRGIAGRRNRSREDERRRLIPLLLSAGPSRQANEDALRAPDLLTDLSVDLIQLVRGEDKANLVASAARLGVPQRLLERLRSGTPRVRVTAAEALAAFPNEKCVEALVEALDDPNADVRLTAAISLAEIDRAPPAALLIDRLGIGTSENSMLIVSLFEEIARTRSEEIKALIVHPSYPSAVKAAAIDALSLSGDYSLVPIISDLALASDPADEELPRFLRALGGFAHPAGGPAVRHCLASPVWWVRAAAAEAAGRIGLLDTALRLAELLGDADWWVRFRAGEALVHLGEPGRRLLGEVARCGSEEARLAAALTLGEHGLAA
jgi:HEAT repeat protein